MAKNDNFLQKKNVFLKKYIYFSHRMKCFSCKKNCYMKKILLLALCYLSVNAAYTQSDKNLTHYMFDRISFNPGATGYKGYCGTVVGREQWVATDFAPRTFLMNLEGNLQKLNAGVGLSLMNDAIGFG